VDTLLHLITKCLHPAYHLVDSHCISGLKRLAYRTGVSPNVATRASGALMHEPLSTAILSVQIIPPVHILFIGHG
jgi:hypothetical protein